jgi:large subunit ribosomal protein L28
MISTFSKALTHNVNTDILIKVLYLHLIFMARKCELTGKSVMYGNNVSHANNKLSKRFLPNLQNVTFISDVIGHSMSLRVSTNGIRSVEANGGLDNFLLNAHDHKLGKKALAIKKTIKSKQKN